MSEENDIQSHHIIDINLDGYVTCDKNFHILSANDTAKKLLACNEPHQLIQKLANILTSSASYTFSSIEDLLHNQHPFSSESFDAEQDKWFDITLYPQHERLTVCIRDITEQKLIHRSLQESELRFHTMLESVVDSVILIDEQGTIILCNGAVQDLFDYSPKELIGRNVSLLMDGDNRDNHDDFIANYLKTGQGKIIGYGREVNGLKRDMTTFPLELEVNTFSISGRRFFMGTMRDLSKQKHDEKQIHRINAQLEKKINRREKQLKSINRRMEKLALHDPLTGLPNRTLFQKKLHSGIQSAELTEQPLILILLDLDNFKEINDTLGHDVGDELLKTVSERITKLLRTGDTVARLGGDEFGIILMRTNPEGAVKVAQNILNALEPHFDIAGHTLNIKASIGIAVYREHGNSEAILMKHADVAMYEAKRHNTGFSFYDATSDPHTPDKLSLLSELKLALKNNHLQLYYQPKMDLSSGKSFGAEALLRWHHKDKGMIPPDVFVPLAEQAGLIKSLTHWVLETAMRQYSEWASQGIHINIAVNLSAKNLDDDELPSLIGEKLKAWSVPPENLILEITETSIISDPAQALKILTRLDNMGVTLSIDDYGTGYSSLAYVKKLPVDEIKIDRSFVATITSNHDDAVIVKSTINLAHDLGMRTVAEGVEDKETVEYLRSLNCDHVQGYYFSRPLPVDQATSWFLQYINTSDTEVV